MIENQSDTIRIRLARLLLISSVCLFAGRSFQHLFQDIPVRILLWDQMIMESFVNNILGISWDDYIQDPAWDAKIQLLIKFFGFIYLACLAKCIHLLFTKKLKYSLLLVIGGVLLFLLSLIYFMDKFARIGELMEYTCQWISPLLLYFILHGKIEHTRADLIMRVAIVLTFTGHALYAIGFYPVPGPFIDMIIMSMNVSQRTAETILHAAGWLDIGLSVLILLPYTYRYAAAYAFAWGALTAIARIWANFDPSLTAESFFQWLPEVLVRVPNALIPLGVFLLPRWRSREMQV